MNSDLLLGIHSVNADGTPSSSAALTSVSLAPSQIHDLFTSSFMAWQSALSVEFDFPDIPVTVGDELAIVLSTSSGSFNITMRSGEYYGFVGAASYSGGHTYWDSGSGWTTSSEDLFFKTYVDTSSPGGTIIPLPSAAWMGLGLLGLLGVARKIRRKRAA